MKRKTFALLTALLAVCTLLNTAFFMAEEGAWLADPGYRQIGTVRPSDSRRA